MLKLKNLITESKLLLEFDSKTNITQPSAEEIVKQLAQEDGSGNTEIWKAMGGATGWGPGALKQNVTAGKTPADWVAEVGADVLAKRISDVQQMVAAASPGLPKKEMPAIEGEDVDAVVDALGDKEGKIAIDLASKWGAGDQGGSFDNWWDALEPEQQDLFDKPGFKDAEEIAAKLNMPTDSEISDIEGDAFGESKTIKLANLLKEDPFPSYGEPFPGAPTRGEGAKTNLGQLKGKSKAFLMKGMLDGGATDSIDIELDSTLSNSEMKPTQSNILLGKSMMFAYVAWAKPNNFLDMEGAFVTTDGDILDGHHRWSGQAIGQGKGQHTGVHKVAGKASTLIPILTTIGNALGRDQKGKPKKEEPKSVFN